MQDIIQRYLDCWNETGAEARRKLIEQVWALDATYTDPMAEVAGRAAIDATITAVQAQFPGFVFTLAAFLDGKVARWQVPENWTFIEEVPKTTVGKFDKKVLRARYQNGDLQVHRSRD